MDEHDVLRQERLQLWVIRADGRFRATHCVIDLPHRRLQIDKRAHFGGDGLLPIPLINIKRMEVVELFICPYRVHICIDTRIRSATEFRKFHALPFRQ